MDAGKNRADVLVEFQHGPLPDLAAAEFGHDCACARLAQNYVVAKIPVRRLGLTVTSPLPDGRMRVYGTAIYNGNLAALIRGKRRIQSRHCRGAQSPAKRKGQSGVRKACCNQPGATAAATPMASQKPRRSLLKRK